MKKQFLLITVLFISILSSNAQKTLEETIAQYDFLKETLRHLSSAPSILVVKVQSPSYKGEAYVFNSSFYHYYKEATKEKCKIDKYCKFAYRDIKRGKYFIISDKDLGEDGSFRKIILNDSVLSISKKGIEFFIRTFFDNEGTFNGECDLSTIIKVLFDAGIKIGFGCEYFVFEIQDPRFYNKNGELVIPLEYRDNKN